MGDLCGDRFNYFVGASILDRAARCSTRKKADWRGIDENVANGRIRRCRGGLGCISFSYAVRLNEKTDCYRRRF